MTQEEINLVKQSWKTLRSVDPQVIGDVFYTKLFFDTPALKAMFRQPISDQSAKLVATLSVIVARLGHLDGLKKDVIQLAVRHRSYGVKAAHYDLVGNALIWTLEKAFGPEWNEPLAKAWLKCYTTLASMMVVASEEPRHESRLEVNN